MAQDVAHDVKLKLALNFGSSCLCLQSARITAVRHHVRFLHIPFLWNPPEEHTNYKISRHSFILK